MGKPVAGFFAAALDHLDVDVSAAVMIGDDIDADVLAAQRNGITGAPVRTGKYLPEAVADGQVDDPKRLSLRVSPPPAAARFYITIRRG